MDSQPPGLAEYVTPLAVIRRRRLAGKVYGTQHGGGCIVNTPDTDSWPDDHIYIIPFHVPRLEATFGGLLSRQGWNSLMF